MTKAQWLKRGTEVNLLAWGYTAGLAYRAATVLEAEGISAGVLDLRCLKPLDYEKIEEASQLPMVMIEEIVRQGSCGQEIALWLEERQKEAKFTCLHLDDKPVLHGKRNVVLEAYGISVEKLVSVTKTWISGRQT